MYYDVDQSVFYKVIGHRLTIILVHVNDCMIAATSIGLVNVRATGVELQEIP